MRNFNTSSVKNAIRSFVSEAMQVLRALCVPVTELLRGFQSGIKRPFSEQAIFRYRPLSEQPFSLRSFGKTFVPARIVTHVVIDRSLSDGRSDQRWRSR